MPLPQSVTASVHFSRAASGSRVPSSGVRRDSRVPNAKASTPGPGSDGRVEEQHECPRVCVHRAGDVAEHDELPRHLLAGAIGTVDSVAAGPQRVTDQAAKVEAIAAWVGAAPTRSTQRPVLGDRRDQPPHTPVLVGRHFREVLLAQQLVGRGRRARGGSSASSSSMPSLSSVSDSSAESHRSRALEPSAPGRGPAPAGTRRGTPGRTGRDRRDATRASGAGRSRRPPGGSDRR